MTKLSIVIKSLFGDPQKAVQGKLAKRGYLIASAIYNLVQTFGGAYRTQKATSPNFAIVCTYVLTTLTMADFIALDDGLSSITTITLQTSGRGADI